jgi:hypothetical protein
LWWCFLSIYGGPPDENLILGWAAMVLQRHVLLGDVILYAFK